MNLEIPGELITKNSNEIEYDLLNGKIVVGLCGYRGSGKDTLAKQLVERLGFKRISFADLLKKDLNEYMKTPIFNHLQEKGMEIGFNMIDFENPCNNEIKEILRPYMIWYGEELKKINGIHHWTNNALNQIGENDKKIVITDVRRENELFLFKKNRRSKEKCIKNLIDVDMPMDCEYYKDVYDLKFETLLFYVNQLENTDSDVLTKKTILRGLEEWLFDDIIEIDSRLKEEKYQAKHILNHVHQLTEKYPKYFI